MDKLKVLKGKEVQEEELKPVLSISKIFIVPLILGLIFGIIGNFLTGLLVFLMFAGLGYEDYKNGKDTN